MKKLFAAAVLFTLGILVGLHLREEPPTALAGGPACAAQNGDTNGDGSVNISDAVTILGNLFLGTPPQLPPLCVSSPTGLPDTGQTQCYDCSGQSKQCLDCSGRPRPCGGFTEDFLTLQDAFQRTGCPNDADRFTANGDGTVTDNCTGLMWQQRTADVNSDGQSTSEDVIPWCSALNFCLNLGLAGHTDWRLPNVRELESIVDYGRVNPAIAPVFSSLIGRYWSSTSFEGRPEAAWLVEFFGGLSTTCAKDFSPIGDPGCCDKTCEGFVRAVRGP
jgi:hypothetical protein